MSAFALRNIGDPSSTEPLLEAAREADPYVRGAALEALGSLSDDRIPAILIAALKDDNFRIKRSALMALANLRCAAAGGPILDIFKNYAETRTDDGMSWAEVRTWAANALGHIGHEPAVIPLIRALDDRDRAVRQAAYYALMYIKDAVEDEDVKKTIQKERDEYEKRL